MLSYQHIYHAGNAADVHKHLWLIRVLSALRTHKKPITWVDTHAGRGLYDLGAPEAQKLAEYRDGYLKFRDTVRNASGDVKTYFNLVDDVNRKRKGFYPGSALIAAKMLTPQDRLIACEMHKGEIEFLKKSLQSFSQTTVLKQDGYAALLDLSPFPLGGVLIDPSYEVKTEYMQVLDVIQNTLQKWPQGIFLIWYPILKAGNHLQMLEGFRTIKDVIIDEKLFRDPATEGKGMAGSGVILINFEAKPA